MIRNIAGRILVDKRDAFLGQLNGNRLVNALSNQWVFGSKRRGLWLNLIGVIKPLNRLNVVKMRCRIIILDHLNATTAA